MSKPHRHDSGVTHEHNGGDHPHAHDGQIDAKDAAARAKREQAAQPKAARKR